MTKLVDVQTLQRDYPVQFEKELEAYGQHMDWPWWDAVYEDWVDRLAEMGVVTEKDDISFSGFWSQGDGASFTGQVNPYKFWHYHEDKGADPGDLCVVEAWREGALGYIWLRRTDSRYCHENTVRADGPERLDIFEDFVVGSGLFKGQPVQEFMDEVVEPRLESFNKWVEDACRGYMCDLYNDLEAEFEYLTSAEAFIEDAESNDREFEVEEDEDESDY